LASRAHFRHQEDIDYVRLKNESAATYDGWTAYGRSKLSNILMTKVSNPSHEIKKKNKTKRKKILIFWQALAARFPQSTGVSFYSNHPGVVDTGHSTVK
jgi:hypothetical protein